MEDEPGEDKEFGQVIHVYKIEDTDSKKLQCVLFNKTMELLPVANVNMNKIAEFDWTAINAHRYNVPSQNNPFNAFIRDINSDLWKDMKRPFSDQDKFNKEIHDDYLSTFQNASDIESGEDGYESDFSFQYGSVGVRSSSILQEGNGEKCEHCRRSMCQWRRYRGRLVGAIEDGSLFKQGWKTEAPLPFVPIPHRIYRWALLRLYNLHTKSGIDDKNRKVPLEAPLCVIINIKNLYKDGS